MDKFTGKNANKLAAAIEGAHVFLFDECDTGRPELDREMCEYATIIQRCLDEVRVARDAVEEARMDEQDAVDAWNEIVAEFEEFCAANQYDPFRVFFDAKKEG